MIAEEGELAAIQTQLKKDLESMSRILDPNKQTHINNIQEQSSSDSILQWMNARVATISPIRKRWNNEYPKYKETLKVDIDLLDQYIADWHHIEKAAGEKFKELLAKEKAPVVAPAPAPSGSEDPKTKLADNATRLRTIKEEILEGKDVSHWQNLLKQVTAITDPIFAKIEGMNARIEALVKQIPSDDTSFQATEAHTIWTSIHTSLLDVESLIALYDTISNGITANLLPILNKTGSDQEKREEYTEGYNFHTKSINDVRAAFKKYADYAIYKKLLELQPKTFEEAVMGSKPALAPAAVYASVEAFIKYLKDNFFDSLTTQEWLKKYLNDIHQLNARGTAETINYFNMQRGIVQKKIQQQHVLLAGSVDAQRETNAMLEAYNTVIKKLEEHQAQLKEAAAAPEPTTPKLSEIQFKSLESAEPTSEGRALISDLDAQTQANSIAQQAFRGFNSIKEWANQQIDVLTEYTTSAGIKTAIDEYIRKHNDLARNIQAARETFAFPTNTLKGFDNMLKAYARVIEAYKDKLQALRAQEARASK